MKGICLTVFTLFASTAFAQSISITNIISNNGTSVDSDFQTTYSFSGTATFTPGGAATFSVVNGQATRDRGLGCDPADVIQFPITFTFSNGDTLTILMQAQEPKGGTVLTSNFSVIGGTGSYAGKGGSGSMTLTLANIVQTPKGTNGGHNATFTLTGSGSMTLGGALTPSPIITPSGVVPLFSEVPIIQPGSWISIYGSNFASTTTVWNGDFKTSLGGVSVQIDNKPAFMYVVEPTQINVQAPDDATSGCVPVVVNTPNGQVSYSVMLEPQSPSLSLWADGKHAAGFIYDNTVAQGYTLLAPAGSIPGVTTRAVKGGEYISLYGVGFGPTKQPVPAGQTYVPTVANPILSGVGVTIGGVNVPNQNVAVTLAGEGLYQINIQIPQVVPSGDQLITISYFGQGPPVIGDNYQTQATPAVYIPVQ